MSRLSAKILRANVGLQFCVLVIPVFQVRIPFFFFHQKIFCWGGNSKKKLLKTGFSQRVLCPPCRGLGVGTGVTCGL